mgnify:CR=1 FL=1
MGARRAREEKAASDNSQRRRVAGRTTDRQRATNPSERRAAARAEVVEVLAAGVWALLLAGRAGQAESSDMPSVSPDPLTQSVENTGE